MPCLDPACEVQPQPLRRGWARVLAWAGVLLTATAPLMAQVRALAPPALRNILGAPGAAPGAASLPGPGEVEAAGDFFMAGRGRGGLARRVELWRSRGEVYVRKKPAALLPSGVAAVRQELSARGLVSEPGGQGGRSVLLRSTSGQAAAQLRALRASSWVEYAAPVLVHPASGRRLVVTDEVLAAFPPGVRPEEALAEISAAGLVIVGPVRTARLNVHRLRVVAPALTDALSASRALAAGGRVLWAEPNFLREIEKTQLPDDPLLPLQQALRNTGQNGAVAGADVNAADAWTQAQGAPGIVVAVLDDGIDTSHPDLRIATNPGETGGGKESNGLDDDGNGYVDDHRGWDFAGNDNNPNPGNDSHGTGCAGIVAAVAGNQQGVAGIAHGCRLLPVKIISDAGVFASDVVIGEAISYAADHADVLTNSWGGEGSSSFIDSAIEDASRNGRGGKGCPVFFASGNGASTWMRGGGRYRLSTAGLSGRCRFGFFYYRGNTTGGENAFKIDDVCLLGADGHTHLQERFAREGFENFFFPPPDWPLYIGGGATATWEPTADNAFTSTGGWISASSPQLAEGQYTWLFTPPMEVTGVETLAFAASISMPAYAPGGSMIFVDVYDEFFTTYYGSYGPLNQAGVPVVNAATSYPANSPYGIAVGAVSDHDIRSIYSQYAGKLDFVAPSNGGLNDIVTTDALGNAGRDPGDYMASFGGTSAACPMAAGVAALLLSKAPHLTRDRLLTLMRGSCDQVGGVVYTDGRHPEYGYGRVNAGKALQALDALRPTVVAVPPGPYSKEPVLGFTFTFSEAVSGLTAEDVMVTNGSVTRIMGEGPSYLVEVTPVAEGEVTCALPAGTVVNALGDPNQASNQAAVIYDVTAPVVEISAPSRSLTAMSPVTYLVQCQDSALAAGELISEDIIVHTTGTALAQVAVSGAAGVWTVTLTPTKGDGTLAISVAEGAFEDLAGNGSATTGPSNAVGVDNTPPGVVLGPPSTALTRGGPVSFSVTYADERLEAVTLTAADVVLNKTGTANAQVQVTGDGAVRVITLTNIQGDGSLAVSLAAGTATDSVGNLARAEGPSATVMVDNTVPTLSSVSLASNNANPALARQGDALTLRLTPSEIIAQPRVLLAGAEATVMVAEDGAWTASAPVLASTPEGPVSLRVEFMDLAGNEGAAHSATTDASGVQVDLTPPVITAVSLSSNNAVAGFARPGDTLTLDLTTSEPIQAPLVTLGGLPAVVEPRQGNAWRARLLTSTEIPQGPVAIEARVVDLAGNPAPPAISTTDGTQVIFDQVPPQIQVPPSAVTVNPGEDVVLTVVAESLAPLSWQWYRNDEPLAGAVAASLTLEAVEEADQGMYHVVISSIAGTTASTPVLLDVNDPVFITQHPMAVQVNENSPVSLQVAAVGTPPLSYQWRKNGEAIPGSQAERFELASVQELDGAVYDVEVGNVVGVELSEPAALVVRLGSPGLVRSPAPRTVVAGMAVRFEVEAAGSAPLTYQWRKNGSVIPGATSPVLLLAEVSAADAGAYSVVVANQHGRVTSAAAALTVAKAAAYRFTTLAGQAGSPGHEDAAQPADTRWRGAAGVALVPGGGWVVADRGNHVLRMVSADGSVSTLAGLAGSAGAEDGQGADARMTLPSGVAVDGAGMMYVVESGSHLLRRVTPGGQVSTLAGAAGIPGADDATGLAARFRSPRGVAVDEAGMLYVADTGNHTLRRVGLDGVVTTLCGVPGSPGHADGVGAAARLHSPVALVWAQGGLWVAEEGGHVIRRWTPAQGLVTMAGKSGVSGAADGKGLAARFKAPQGLAVDADGNVFIADTGNQLLRMMSPGGVVTTLAGKAGAAGTQDGAGLAARFNGPQGVAVDALGRLLVADTDNHSLRQGVRLDLPIFVEQPRPALVMAGESVTFSAAATGAEPLAWQWYRAGAMIKGATSPVLTLPAVTVTNAGAYHVVVKNSAGVLASAPAELAVVQGVPQAVVVNEGTPASFKVQAAGNGLVYLWRRGGVSVTGARAQGQGTAAFGFRPAAREDSGDYRCLVRLGELRLEAPPVELRVYHQPPRILAQEGSVLAAGVVGGTYRYTVPMDADPGAAPARFAATGLPPGMKIDPATGVISGRPAAASPSGKPYRMVVTATNARGSSRVTLLLEVSPMPALAVGVFQGLVDAHPALNQDLGGALTLTTTSAGGYTGNLVLGGAAYRIAGALEVSMGGRADGSVEIARAQALPLRLSFAVDGSTGLLQGDVTTPTVQALVVGGPVAFIRAARASLAPALAGRYVAAILPADDTAPTGVEFPGGEGYAVLSVSASGKVTWTGKLPDGTDLTQSGNLGPAGESPLHVLLYGKTGSIQGWARWAQAGGNVDGSLEWCKAAQAEASPTRSYKGGFARHERLLAGGKYVPPAVGVRVLDLGAQARIRFDGGGLPAPLAVEFLLSQANVPTPPQGHASKLRFTTFHAATGLFSGSFEVPDAAARGAAFSGALVPRLGRGAGFFLLPEATGVINKSAILSGAVTLESAP